MKIKVADATPVQLDWLVARILSIKTDIPSYATTPWIRCTDESGVQYVCPKWSTDWSQGGPIIEREEIGLYKGENASAQPGWHAYLWGKRGPEFRCNSSGPTALIAAMRCFVTSRLGEEVDVPEELCR